MSEERSREPERDPTRGGSAGGATARRSLVRAARSRSARWTVSVVSVLVVVVLAALAARHFATTSWPLASGNALVLVAAGLLLVAAQVLKSLGWSRLFTRSERPSVLALAAGNGGAALIAVVLPGRFDEAMRVAVVRRYPGCRAGVRTIVFSLLMLGLIDAVALAPLAAVAAAFPTGGTAVRLGLGVVAAGGVAAAAAIAILPRLAAGRRASSFRIGRWVAPRTTSRRSAAEAWFFVSLCWLVRGVAVFLLLGTLGLGFSFPLALLFLCAGAAAAAVPFGPLGSTAAQVGAGAMALIAAGVEATPALAAAVSAGALGVISGGAILGIALCWGAGTFLVRAAARPGLG